MRFEKEYQKFMEDIADNATTDTTVKFHGVPKPPPAIVQKVDSRPSANPANFVSGTDFLTKAKEYIKQNEGVKSVMYNDRGKFSIGIGHSITPQELPYYKNKTLTNAEITQLFERDVAGKMRLIKAKFGSTFDTYSDDLKIAILDGYFRGDLSGSPKTIQLLLNKKFKEAAQEYLNNAEYREAKTKKSGVARRMERNAATMAAEPSDKPENK